MLAGGNTGISAGEVATGAWVAVNSVVKLADTLVLAFIVTVQLEAMPPQAPPQPERPQPGRGLGPLRLGRRLRRHRLKLHRDDERQHQRVGELYDAVHRHPSPGRDLAGRYPGVAAGEHLADSPTAGSLLIVERRHPISRGPFPGGAAAARGRAEQHS